MPPVERLQKFLARAGVASRRASEELIQSGHIRVNGQVITELGYKIDPAKDRVEADGKEIGLPQKAYIMYNKPRNIITSCSDPQGRDTVMEHVPEIPGLHPVGRLDRASEGLLFLTNDGDFTLKLTHPRHGIEKTYRAYVQGHPNERALQTLRDGVMLSDGRTAPAKVELLEKDSNGSWLELVIHEGRNRQVRRMCEAVGFPVIRLKRIQVGPIDLKGLRPGQYRNLTPEEVQALEMAAEK